METLPDWNADEISAVRSPSGVLLLADWRTNLIRPAHGIWPPAVVAKLSDAERPGSPLPEPARTQTAAALGHRTALQSLTSEDAITWSVFGPLMDASPQLRADFVNWVCQQLGLPWTDNQTAIVDLWRRVPHPDKPRAAGGPELDAVLVGDRCVVFVEAKWGSGEGQGQGVSRTKGQIQLRCEFLVQYGKRIWGEVGMLVLGAVRSSPIAADSGPDEHGVAVRSLTWPQLASWPEHPSGDELTRYLQWKAKHSRAKPSQS